ncbi:hypothetical protein ECC02_010297 [Trypanosoma cruzi]|uniref:Uncharacterized protein n=1 Tax=Trypanosoma cruzi TaxID=5693 RepID=A0A7J6XQW0_TRYCR|nr:hypothetical protein ECC02_010297 [Trypanosoma cruzi]
MCPHIVYISWGHLRVGAPLSPLIGVRVRPAEHSHSCVWGLREARRHDGSRVTPSGSERSKRKKSSGGREMLTGLPAREMNTKSKKETKTRKTRRQGVAVCVWRCGCLLALAAKKQNKRERNVCSAPQAPVARPHVTAPSARRSSRPLLMRAAGEAHRAVVMSVSVGVRVEQLGGKHTAPLTGRVQQKNIKEGRVEKKTSMVIAPKAKRRGNGG